jgi:muramidase (phage lysozyme)
MTLNISAFLSMIAVSEGTKTCPETQDDGYDVLVGGTTFYGYADHPRIVVNLGNGLYSTAAGRYQILERYYDAYKTQLSLPDFGHNSQDATAIQMILECNAIGDIKAGDLQTAVAKCSSRWASFPSSEYGQTTQKYATLLAAYKDAGGITT